jgi:hypothetical protein
MAKGMTTGRLGDIRLPDSSLHCPLHYRFVEVMASDAPRARIPGELGGREDVLPRPLAIGIGVFAL